MAIFISFPYPYSFLEIKGEKKEEVLRNPFHFHEATPGEIFSLLESAN